MIGKQPVYDSTRGRRFAFTVAGAFGAIALLTLWRERETIALVTGTLSALLLVAGVLFPSKLEPVERGWMKMALLISRVTTPIFMGIVYFVVLTPAGVIRRTFGKNPLVHSKAEDSYWAPRDKRDPVAARRRMERQF